MKMSVDQLQDLLDKASIENSEQLEELKKEIADLDEFAEGGGVGHFGQLAAQVFRLGHHGVRLPVRHAWISTKRLQGNMPAMLRAMAEQIETAATLYLGENSMTKFGELLEELHNDMTKHVRVSSVEEERAAAHNLLLSTDLLINKMPSKDRAKATLAQIKKNMPTPVKKSASTSGTPGPLSQLGGIDANASKFASPKTRSPSLLSSSEVPATSASGPSFKLPIALQSEHATAKSPTAPMPGNPALTPKSNATPAVGAQPSLKNPPPGMTPARWKELLTKLKEKNRTLTDPQLLAAALQWVARQPLGKR